MIETNKDTLVSKGCAQLPSPSERELEGEAFSNKIMVDNGSELRK
jgi:hypothetical protein